jgi:polyketide cyclase/dehydrase/lipid transport protein
MIEFTIDTEIARPVDEVFAYVTDPGKLATWQTNTVSARQQDEGPLGLGSPLERSIALPVAESSPRPSKSWSSRPTGRSPCTWSRGRSRSTPASRSRPATVERRCASPCTGGRAGWRASPSRFCAWVLRRQFAGYCETLKQVLEGGAPQAIDARSDAG